MIRTVIVTTVLVAGLVTPSNATSGPAATAAQSAAQATAADAGPFIGEWTLDLQSQDGPRTFALIVKVEKEKEKETVVGEITGGTMPAQPIADVTKADKSLILRYSFDYQGNPVPTVVSLTPAPEDKMNAQIDFAGGAYIMSGTATKKEKAK